MLVRYLERIIEKLCSVEFVNSCEENFAYYSAMNEDDNEMKSLKISQKDRDDSLAVLYTVISEDYDALDLDAKDPNMIWKQRLHDHMRSPTGNVFRAYF